MHQQLVAQQQIRVMRSLVYRCLPAATLVATWLFFSMAVCAQLKVSYTEKYGLSFLSYNGNTLLDVNSQKGSPLTLEAFTYSNTAKQVLTEWSYVGATHWDAQQQVYSVDSKWGTLFCKYKQQADTLFFSITFLNRSQTDTFYGVSFCPLTISLDKRPSNFQPLFPYYNNNRVTPTLVTARLDNYKILLESNDVHDHTYLGFREENNSAGKRYAVWSGNWPFNGMTNFDTRSELRLAPGKSVTYGFAMKFLQNDVSLKTSSAAIISRFTGSNPSVIKWKDRRPVGMLFLASYNEAVSNANNPRRWVMTNNKVDNTPEGKAAFRKQVFDFADTSIRILQQTHAQGMITWDIEGQQYPHPLSYIGSPDLLNMVAPEMNEVADAYFQRFKEKGLKTGICIRPDSIVFNKDRNWIDHVAVKDPAATLIRKIAYARKRWGCTIFYIDSNVGADGQPMDPHVFMAVNRQFPDVLLVPEHSLPLYFAYTAPYGEFRRAEYKVNNDVKALYPDAFMCLVVPEGFPAGSTPAQQQAILKEGAAAGNIFLFRCWFHDEPVNSLIKQNY